MEISALGGARQVGRSAFLVKGSEQRVLLDFGVITSREPAFPMHISSAEVEAILLTHAHLDHSGGIPLFFISNGAKVYATALTAELSGLLIEDFLKISGFYLPFEYVDLMSMLKGTVHVNMKEEFQIGEFRARFFCAGHIPGASSILLEHKGQRLLYTGDINTRTSRLVPPADLDFGELDILITESTYATVDHPDQEQVEREFVQYAREVVERNGTLLVPAFSVGRAQEIACVLRAHDFPYRVAMDGMALKTNEILRRHQESLGDAKHFRKSLENVEFITSWSQRKSIVKTPCVVISPAGMLVGGAVLFYVSEVAMNPRNGISIVSFQAPGTPGRTLLDKGLALVNGTPKKIKSELKRFDLSSHSGRKELFAMMKQIKGNPKILAVHGDKESCVTFASEIKQTFGFDAEAPEVGQKFEFQS